MRFLIDAQLPVRLARFLQHAGHDAVHPSALPAGNHTTDTRITEIADSEFRVVVTKDLDFRDGHLLTGSPRRLLVVATGNIGNDDLLALFRPTSTPSPLPSTTPTSSSWDREHW